MHINLLSLWLYKMYPKTFHEVPEGCKVINPLIFKFGARWAWLVNTTPRPLYLRQRNPVPTVQEAEWVPERVWTSAEKSRGYRIETPDRPACSELLYRLSYTGQLPMTAITVRFVPLSVAHFLLKNNIRQRGCGLDIRSSAMLRTAQW